MTNFTVKLTHSILTEFSPPTWDFFKQTAIEAKYSKMPAAYCLHTYFAPFSNLLSLQKNVISQLAFQSCISTSSLNMIFCQRRVVPKADKIV